MPENPPPLRLGLVALLAFVGLPFDLVGGGILAFTARTIDPQALPNTLKMPAFGAVFLFAGLVTTAAALVILRRDLDRRRRYREFPDRPWRLEPAFDDFGTPSTAGSSPLTLWAFTLGFGVLCSLFALVFWSAGAFDESFIPKIVFGVFGLVILLLLVQTVKRTIVVLRFGAPRLEFTKLPARPGERMQVALTIPGELAGTKDLKGKLIVTRSTSRTMHVGGRTETRTDTERVHTADVVIPRGRAQRLGNSTIVLFDLDLPEGLPGRDSESNPSWAWLLEVVAEEPGVDFSATFDLPVYTIGASLEEPRPGPMPA